MDLVVRERLMRLEKENEMLRQGGAGGEDSGRILEVRRPEMEG